MNRKKELAVVTVTYKPEIDELKLFIESFYKYNDLGDEAKLIIVDNSPENFWDYTFILKKYPELFIIPNPSNPGFGTSNNIGFDKIASKYVLFINNDAEFIEPVFKKIINKFQCDNKLGCVGIHQYGGSPSFFPKMTAPKDIKNNSFNDKYHFISGAFMFFNSEKFIDIGKFDPNIFMYFEEFDISNRLLKNGFHTIYINELSFLHKVKNRRIVSEFSWKKGIPSFCYICKKYNLDPSVYSRPIMKRLRILQIYHALKLNFGEVRKLQRIIDYRKDIIWQNFKVRI